MFFNPTKSVQAKLVGSTVVATFRRSNPSLIWKYDLERNHSFTLALQGEEGDFELGITSPKGDFSTIALFATREEAEEAFEALNNVLMKRRGFPWRPLLAGVVGIFLIFFAFNFFANLWQMHKASVPKPSIAQGSVSAPNPASVFEPGVPQPADNVLRPPN